MDEHMIAMEQKVAQNIIQIEYMEKRIEALEEQTKSIQHLTLSVEKLALNMESMLKEQTEQGDRLKKLEDQPAEKWNTVQQTLLTTVISTIGGGIAGALITFLTNFAG